MWYENLVETQLPREELCRKAIVEIRFKFMESTVSDLEPARRKQCGNASKEPARRVAVQQNIRTCWAKEHLLSH